MNEQMQELVARIEGLQTLVGQKDEEIYHLRRALASAQQQLQVAEGDSEAEDKPAPRRKRK